MKLFKKIIEIVFIWILMLAIVTLICSHIFSKTVLNQNYILGQLEKENYYNSVYHEIQSNFEGYIGPSGFDETIFEGIVSEDQVKEDIIKIVSHIYTGEDYTLQIEEIREKLNHNIYESLLNYNVSAEEKESISHFEEEMIKEYQEQITHSQYFEILEGILPKIIKKLPMFQLVLGLTAMFAVVILFALSRKKMICSIADSILAASLFLLLIKLWISSQIEISNITILNDAFSNIVSNILKNILDNWNMIGIIGASLSIMVLVIFNIFLYKDKKDTKSQ